jgi:hypothetical protein
VFTSLFLAEVLGSALDCSDYFLSELTCALRFADGFATFSFAASWGLP